MRTIVLVGIAAGTALLLGACRGGGGGAIDAKGESAASESRSGVDLTLDAMHTAASRADGPRYFATYVPDAVFLGTDASERWTLAEFRAYAEPYFAQGRGWTYVPRDRSVFVSGDGRTAWFDERLSNEKYGECRGTGVLVKRADGLWRISQYNLSKPVRNELMDGLLELERKDAMPR